MKPSALVATLASAAAVAGSTLTPPVLPLFVRNPYLSIWLTGARENPWENWPIFWTGKSVGFSIMASVPDARAVYPLLGRPQDSLSRSDPLYTLAFPEYLGATFDASTTNLTYRLPSPSGRDDGGEPGAPLQVTLSFLSPITPTSTFRQSIPAAYLSVLVEGSFDVDIYLDLNGEWVSGNRDNRIRWDLREAADDADDDAGAGASSSSQSKPSAPDGPPPSTPLKTWRVSRAEQQLFTEFADHAEWGELCVSAPASVRHESGLSARIRTQFARNGSLANVVDSGFRRIMEEEPIFAFSQSFRLGSKGKEKGNCSDSVLFTVSLIQDPIVQYASARGLTLMRPLWASYIPTADALIQYHYDDFAAAAALAGRYAARLSQDAFASGSQAYEEIASLSARQVLGATAFGGTPDSPLLFLKEISSNGNCQTVDVIFPAFPFFLYTNPRWLAYLLEPLLEHQLSGQYPNDYSMHDLGYHFPNQTGHSDGHDEYMPVEECGNMLIMGLALVNAYEHGPSPADAALAGDAAAVAAAAVHAPRLALTAEQARHADAYGLDRPWGAAGDAAGDAAGEAAGAAAGASKGHRAAKAWVARSYRLWKQWTGYLVRESLVPRWQLSTDDFAGWLAYQTNLALKGIIGIRAMSELARVVGDKGDAAYYRNISETYVAKWQEYGISRDGTHAKLAYDWYGSWTTLYNLYADALLCFHLPAKSSSSSGGKKKTPPPTSPFIPDRVYTMQSNWYHNVLQRYGLPLDSRHLYTKSDWEFFAAAVTSKATRTEILASVARWLNETETTEPFTDLYETEGRGGYPGGLTFKARPVVGGHFAFLALERACGGQAVEGLAFLDRPGGGSSPPSALDVQAALDDDRRPFLDTSKAPPEEVLEL